jgi:hypothetical protein
MTAVTGCGRLRKPKLTYDEMLLPMAEVLFNRHETLFGFTHKPGKNFAGGNEGNDRFPVSSTASLPETLLQCFINTPDGSR